MRTFVHVFWNRWERNMYKYVCMCSFDTYTQECIHTCGKVVYVVWGRSGMNIYEYVCGFDTYTPEFIHLILRHMNEYISYIGTCIHTYIHTYIHT